MDRPQVPSFLLSGLRCLTVSDYEEPREAECELVHTRQANLRGRDGNVGISPIATGSLRLDSPPLAAEKRHMQSAHSTQLGLLPMRRERPKKRRCPPRCPA